MADFNTPIGRIPKPVGYLALAAGAGAAIYVYVKRKNAKKAAASSSQAGASPYGYGTGPSPYAYGAYGYGAFTYEPYGYGFGPYGLGSYGGGGGGGFGYGFYGAGTPAQVPAQATTNAQWSEAAVSALTQGGNYTATQVLAALGVYLMGGQLDASQVTIVQSAIAAEGYPPVPGANGFPPALNSGGTPGGGQGGGGGGSGTKPGAVTGFSVTGHKGFADFGWGVVSGATGYTLSISGPQSTTLNPTGNHAEHVTLKAGRYNASVSAVNSAGTGPAATKSFKVS